MYRKLGLCDIATYDMTAQGGCIPVQIMQCAMKRGWAAGSTGARGTQKQQHEMKKVFKDQQEIMDLLDQIFAKLYVGEPVDPDVDEEPEPETPNIVKCQASEFPEPVFGQRRAYPYEHEGWREVGVTTTMVEQLCRMKGMALIVVRERAVIHRFDPESKEKTRANHTSARVQYLGRSCLLLHRCRH